MHPSTRLSVRAQMLIAESALNSAVTALTEDAKAAITIAPNDIEADAVMDLLLDTLRRLHLAQATVK